MAHTIQEFNAITAQTLPSKLAYASALFPVNIADDYAKTTARQLEVYKRQHGQAFAMGGKGSDAEWGERVLTRLERFRAAEAARDLMLRNPANISYALAALSQGNTALDDIVETPVLETIEMPGEDSIQTDVSGQRVAYWLDKLKRAQPRKTEQ